eukprot:Skav219965  [mRNA]  locus=scaffold2879:311078:321417:+ [translate_table: standard]
MLAPQRWQKSASPWRPWRRSKAQGLPTPRSDHGERCVTDSRGQCPCPSESKHNSSCRNVGNDLTRIQFLDHKYNIEFIAIVAATFLRKNPQGRCAILVINQRVALATVEKLQEYGVSAQYCSARNPVDPSHSVAVCGGCHVRRALRGQSFDIKVVGHDTLTLKEVRARSEVQVAPRFNFKDVEVDYRYSWEQAYIDGRVAALDALVMPLVCWKNSTLQRQVDAVTDLLLLRIADWAPTAVVFHQKKTAKCCISKLQSLGISAEFWPKQLEQEATNKSRLRFRDLRRKLSRSELQVIGCTRGSARYLPEGVRSIIDVTGSRHGARSIPGGIFETLRKLGSSSRNVGDLTRIQLLDHKYNIEFIAIVAATFLRKNPQGRCAILVINQRVALATVEKLQEYGVSAQYCSARNPVDPSHSVAVCGGIHVRRALRGQSFDIKVVGHDILTLKEVRARSEVQVAPSFNLIDVEVDYRYSWEQAYIDGRVAALDALVMPLVCWKNSTLQRQVDAVTDLLLLRIADWAPTAVVFHQKNTAKCCISKLQSLGISAQFWPKQLPENHKTKESRLRLHDLRRKVSQSELQVIGCTRGAARYLPDGVRSIIDVTSSPHSARGIAGGIFETLRKLGNSSRCVYVDVCCYWQSLRYQVRHAAMSLPFWQEVVSAKPHYSSLARIHVELVTGSFFYAISYPLCLAVHIDKPPVTNWCDVLVGHRTVLLQQ